MERRLRVSELGRNSHAILTDADESVFHERWMDDLYNNAWGESVQLDNQDASNTTIATVATTSALSSLNLKPSWSSTGSSSIGPSHAVEDNEADLAAPSWSTGAGILWNEPSEDSHGFGWSHTEPDMAWGVSTYDSMHIGKSRQSLETVKVDEQDKVEPVALSPPSTTASTVSEPEVKEEEEPDETGYANVYQSLGEAEPDAPSSPVERSSSPVTLESPIQTSVPAVAPPRSPSPDGFGGFSSGFEAAESSGFQSGTAGDLENDTWGSAWANVEEESSSDVEEAEDEWTAAQRRQEEFNRRIVCFSPVNVASRSEYCICSRRNL